MPHPPPTFLTLPVEIRLQIYAKIFSPWFRHKPPFGDYPLGITSVCHQTRHESFPLILIDPRHLYSGPSLWELMRPGSQKYLDLISAVTVDFDERTLLQFRKDLLLAPKDISKTVPYSGEWWLATYQDRMSWLPRTPERPSTWPSFRRFLGLSEIPKRVPESFIISTWEAFHKIQHIQKLKLSFRKPGDPGNTSYPVSTSNEQRLLFEIISFACPHISSMTLNSNTPRLLITSCTRFQNLEYIVDSGNTIMFPKGAFPTVNQSLLKIDERPQRHEAVMGGSGSGSGKASIVTIIPPYEYIEAFRVPEPPDHSRIMEFDNH